MTTFQNLHVLLQNVDLTSTRPPQNRLRTNLKRDKDATFDTGNKSNRPKFGQICHRQSLRYVGTRTASAKQRLLNRLQLSRVSLTETCRLLRLTALISLVSRLFKAGAPSSPRLVPMGGGLRPSLCYGKGLLVSTISVTTNLFSLSQSANLVFQTKLFGKCSPVLLVFSILKSGDSDFQYCIFLCITSIQHQQIVSKRNNYIHCTFRFCEKVYSL